MRVVVLKKDDQNPDVGDMSVQGNDETVDKSPGPVAMGFATSPRRSRLAVNNIADPNNSPQGLLPWGKRHSVANAYNPSNKGGAQSTQSQDSSTVSHLPPKGRPFGRRGSLTASPVQTHTSTFNFGQDYSKKAGSGATPLMFGQDYSKKTGATKTVVSNGIVGGESEGGVGDSRVNTGTGSVKAGMGDIVQINGYGTEQTAQQRSRYKPHQTSDFCSDQPQNGETMRYRQRVGDCGTEQLQTAEGARHRIHVKSSGAEYEKDGNNERTRYGQRVGGGSQSVEQSRANEGNGYGPMSSSGSSYRSRAQPGQTVVTPQIPTVTPTTTPTVTPAVNSHTADQV